MAGPAATLGAPPRRGEIDAVLVTLAFLASVLGHTVRTPSAEFDEHVYLASAAALAAGARVGVDVFSSQPPLFFEWLAALHAATGGDATLMRAAAVATALLAAAAAWLLVRQIAGPAAGWAAALLVGLAPQLADRAPAVTAEIPAVALALGALAATIAAARRPAWALAAGGLAVGAVMMKLLALPLLVGMLVAIWSHRLSRRAIALGAGAALLVTAAVTAIYLPALPAIWDGVAGMRGAARDVRFPLTDDGRPLSELAGFAALGALAVLGAALLGRRREPWRARAPLVGALAGAGAFCLLHEPLFVHHLIVLSVPLAVFAASAVAPVAPRPTAAVGLVALVLAPGAWGAREVPGPREEAAHASVAALIRSSTGAHETVVSDLPEIPLLAGRRQPPRVIDSSYVRVGAGRLSRREVVRAARGAGAVVVGRAFRTIPGIRPALASRFPYRVRVAAIDVYLRQPAAPGGPTSAARGRASAGLPGRRGRRATPARATSPSHRPPPRRPSRRRARPGWHRRGHPCRSSARRPPRRPGSRDRAAHYRDRSFVLACRFPFDHP